MNQNTENLTEGQGDFGKNYFSVPSSSHLVPSTTKLPEKSTTESGSLGSNVNNSNRDLEKLLNTDRWNINRYIHQSLITEGVITKR